MFDGFLSYSQRGDGSIAGALKRALEQMGRPWYRRRALRVFRDKETLDYSPELWPAIQSKLDESRFLVVLLSPSARESEWVRREVDYFLGRHGPQRVVLVLADGEIAWDPASGDFDRPASTAIWDRWFSIYDSEPQFVDLRPWRYAERFDLRDRDAEAAVGLIAARLQGRTLDEMVGENRRQHRRTLRTALGAIVLLATLLVVSVVLALQESRARHAAAARLDVAEEVLFKLVTTELTDINVRLGNVRAPTPDDALKRFNAIDEQIQRLRDSGPRNDRVEGLVAAIKHVQGISLGALQRHDEADAALTEAITIQARLAKGTPPTSSEHHTFAGTCNFLAQLRCQMAAFATGERARQLTTEALQLSREAVRALQLFHDLSGDFRYTKQYYLALYSAAQIAHFAKDEVARTRHARRALEIRKEIGHAISSTDENDITRLRNWAKPAK